MAELAWAAPVVVLGYALLGLTGFGSALVVVPLLAWQWPLAWLVPLVLLIDVPAALLHTGLNLRRVAWPELGWLLPPLAAGAALSLWALASWRHPVALVLLGLYVLAVAVRGLRGVAPPPPAAAGWAVPAGLVAGAVEAWFGTSGPVLVAWLARRLPQPEALRATLPLALGAAALLVLMLVGAGVGAPAGASPAAPNPLRDPSLWRAWAVLLPLALGAVWAGHRVARALPGLALARAVYAVLAASGLALVVGQALQLCHWRL